MRIIIVGAGRVGTQLAAHLVGEKHDVAIIEADEERARRVAARLDCLVIQDKGNSLKALEEAGAGRARALVCVTSSDEVNMIICGLAASRFPGLLKIARVRNGDYGRLNLAAAERERILGVDRFVHPDMETARAVLGALAHGAMGNVLGFPGTPYELASIDVAPGSRLDGLLLKDFHQAAPADSLVILLERGGDSVIPEGVTALAGGDRIHVLAREEEMDGIFSLAGRTETPLRRIGVVGGGRIGSLITGGLLGRGSFAPEGEPAAAAPGSRPSFPAFLQSLFGFLQPVSLLKKNLPGKGRRVTIIEQDPRVCRDLAGRFPEALVLNEDISDETFVAEERMGNLDLLITATANQELNMIAALYLKSRGVRKAIALVDGAGYEAIARRLGVDVVIQVKAVVVDSILSHLMGGGVRGVHRLGDGAVDIVEVEIAPQSPAVGKPITAFRLAAGGLLLLVRRGEASFIPRGDYVFLAGDKAALLVQSGGEGDLRKGGKGGRMEKIEKFFGLTGGPAG